MLVVLASAFVAIVTPAGLIPLSLSTARDLDLGSGSGGRPATMPEPASKVIESPPESEQPEGEVALALPAPASGSGEPGLRPEPEPELESPSAEGDERPFYVPGRIVTLRPEPEASFEVAPDGKIKFTAILVNESKEGLKLMGELILVKGDGTKETLLAPRPLRLKAGQRLQLPVELAVRAWGLPQGEVEFLAILRDLQGAIVDQASVSFKITVALERER
ncbi:MAG: hypothetical protein ACUVUT_03130 [Candidatus Bipolaricaulia bacterium]